MVHTKEETMKTFSKITTLFFLITIVTLTGCATNRGIVSLQLPESTTVHEPNGKHIYLESVVDERIFEENPKTQDIPSLGFGGAKNSIKELKLRAIARKRNSFGKALGDILLKPGQTVETVIADALKRSFIETGYQVIDDKENITENTLILKVKIRDFWAYMTPGFWALTLSSDISTDIDITQIGIDTKTITVHSEGKYQIASEKNWMEIVHQSLHKYISEVKTSFKHF